MLSNCPLFGAHHWQLDAKSYGICRCGAEKDFQIKETHKTLWPAGKSAWETEFYNQGSFKLTRDIEWSKMEIE